MARTAGGVITLIDIDAIAAADASTALTESSASDQSLADQPIS